MRILLLIFLLTSFAFAGELKNPPAIQDPAIYDYLNVIKNNFNNLKLTETNPDGNTVGKQGDMVLYRTGNDYYLEICTTASENLWRGIKLQNTP